MVDGCFYYLVLRLCLHPEKYFFSSKKFSSVDIFLLFQFWAKQMAWTYKRKSAFVCTKCTSSNYITLWISAPWGSQQDVAAHYHHAWYAFWLCYVELCGSPVLRWCPVTMCDVQKCSLHGSSITVCDVKVCSSLYTHPLTYIFVHIYKTYLQTK